MAADILNSLREDGWAADAWIPERYASPELTARGCLGNSLELSRWMEERMGSGELKALVFVGACGIAVRAVAPWVTHKGKDPAVIAVDERGIHVIPLLSGHLGGANRLAVRIAEAIGGRPVITTATDINGLFAADDFAGVNGLKISDWKLVKACAARLLEGETLGFYSDFPINGELPRGLAAAEAERADILVTWRRVKDREGEGTPLRLIPPALVLGVGCRRGTPFKSLKEALEAMASQCGIDTEAVAALASIDLKRGELGIVELSRFLDVPFYTFDSESLAAEKGEFSSSAFVRQVTGVDNVCERAAVLAARRLGAGGPCRSGTDAGQKEENAAREEGEPFLLIKKRAADGVAMAAACRPWRIEFR